MLTCLVTKTAIGKTLVSEVCPKQHEARGMGILTGTWGLGLALGPAFGGILSRPVASFPGLFGPGGFARPLRSFLLRYPYCLPNFGTALYALVEFFVILIFFEETLPAPAPAMAVIDNSAVDASSLSAVSGAVDQAPAEGGDVELGGMKRGDDGGRLGALTAAVTGSQHYRRLNQDDTDTLTGSGAAPQPSHSSGGDASSDAVAGDADVDPPLRMNPLQLLRSESQVRRALLAYFLLSVVAITFDEIMPLWALSSFSKVSGRV